MLTNLDPLIPSRKWAAGFIGHGGSEPVHIVGKGVCSGSFIPTPHWLPWLRYQHKSHLSFTFIYHLDRKSREQIPSSTALIWPTESAQCSLQVVLRREGWQLMQRGTAELVNQSYLLCYFVWTDDGWCYVDSYPDMPVLHVLGNGSIRSS